MKVDFSVALTGLDGRVLKDPDATNENGESIVGATFTLSTVCVNALLATMPQENVSGEEKVSRFKLADKIYGLGVVEVAAEDVVLLKKRIGLVYSPLIVGRAFEALEGTEVKDE